MKFSMCSTWAKDKPIEEVLGIAEKMNMDGIEIWSGHVDRFLENGNTLDDLSEELNKHGLECVVIAPYLNLVDKSVQNENMELAHKCISYAAALHCPIVRVFLGDKGSSEVSKDEWMCCFEALEKLGKGAEKAGVSLGIEVHYYQPSDTIQSILRILRAVKSTAVGLIFDGFNFYPSGLEMMDGYNILKQYSIHYHFKNLLWASHLCVPLDEGDVDFIPLIEALRGDGYDGYVSFEYFGSNSPELIYKSKEWFCKIYKESGNVRS